VTIGKEQVESAQDLLFEIVPVPEWGGDARLQEFSADGKAIFGAWGQGIEDGGRKDVKSIVGFAARVVALSLSNDNGTLVYPDFEEGVAALLKRNPKTLNRLSDVTLKLSGITPDAVEKTADELPNTESSSAS
jgi:hypothetical protein